jgi:hypothetical protein
LQFCLVWGDEVELGDVDIEEIKPYIVTRTTDLAEVEPPKGFRWED